jgi:uncharacterized Zn-finger protein
MINRRYNYLYLDALGRDNRLLVCPHCLERLRHEDVQDYQRCPYCDHAFEEDNEFDDFVLQPVVSHWLHQQTRGQNSAGAVVDP